MRNFLLIFSVGFILTGCGEKSDADPVDQGLGYFPLDSGNFYIYNVSHSRKESTVWEHLQYQLKEVIADTFIAGDELSYKLEIYRRGSEAEPWQEVPDSVWTVRIRGDKAIRTENNQRYIKMVFPVLDGRTWDGNAENNYGEDQYVFKNKGSSFQGSNSSYPETVMVLQEADSSNLLGKDLRYEMYAKGVGLIYKKSEVLTFDFSTGDTTNGSVYIQELVSYGP